MGVLLNDFFMLKVSVSSQSAKTSPTELQLELYMKISRRQNITIVVFQNIIFILSDLPTRSGGEGSNLII